MIVLTTDVEDYCSGDFEIFKKELRSLEDMRQGMYTLRTLVQHTTGKYVHPSAFT